jgi:hypothetical protein
LDITEQLRGWQAQWEAIQNATQVELQHLIIEQRQQITPDRRKSVTEPLTRSRSPQWGGSLPTRSG